MTTTKKKTSAKTRDPWATPAMQQYVRCKREQPGCALFFRMGDFYELFGEDATEVGGAMGLTITDRGNGVPVAGVPHHQRDKYLRIAIDLGYRIAVVDQLEDPKDAKGVVERGVTQVITPGTLVDEHLLGDDAAVRLAAVAFESDDLVGCAIADLSTGEFLVADGSPDEIAGELGQFSVREVLFAEPADGSVPPRTDRLVRTFGSSPSGRPAWQFRRDEAMGAIRDAYRVAGVEGFGIDEDAPSLLAAGALVRYLAETQSIGREPTAATSGSEHQRQHATLDHLRPPRRIERAGRCIVDPTSLRALEVERTIAGDRSTTGGGDGIAGSLLGVFLRSTHAPRCCVRTAMGKRLMREWLTSPLADAEAIRDRQQRVGALIDGRALADALGDGLEGMSDVARIAGRLALGRMTPRDLVGLGGSIDRAERLSGVLTQSEAFARTKSALDEISAKLAPVATAIVRSCVESPPAHLREGGLISDGVDAELDEARNLQRDAGAWLADYQTRLIAEHDLPSLKVGFNKVFGYYIELPAAQAKRAPDALTRKQTLKNAERYITPELKTFEDKVTTAEARAVERERVLFDQLCTKARAVVREIQAFADLAAQLDVVLGLATKARTRGWVRPTITEEPTLEIHGGRHPVLDELMDTRFVANDSALASPDQPAALALLTGPNMAGKSTYIRQTALLALLASVGSSIPADRATIGVCDRIFTRVGADDALHRGQSTFMVEMTETATILNNASERSLVVLDEIGRGTSTLDGLSLAWAIAEHLATGEAGSPRCLFATHYHELTELAERMPERVTNLHVAVNEWENPEGRREIVFLHDIRPGRADRSYGVHVAELAGVPRSVIERAAELLETLSVQQAGRVDTSRVEAPKPRRTRSGGHAGDQVGGQVGGQLGLFTEFVPHPAVDRLRELKIESMSPMQAFDVLRELAKIVGDNAGS